MRFLFVVTLLFLSASMVWSLPTGEQAKAVEALLEDPIGAYEKGCSECKQQGLCVQTAETSYHCENIDEKPGTTTLLSSLQTAKCEKLGGSYITAYYELHMGQGKVKRTTIVSCKLQKY